MTADGGALIDKLLSLLTKLIDFMISSLSTILGWLGVSFAPSDKAVLTLILAVIILAALFDYFVRLFGRWIINSIVGLFLLLALHYLFGVAIPITWFTLIVVALLGVPGLLAIIVLYIGGLV
jgi:hypothetical protein